MTWWQLAAERPWLAAFILVLIAVFLERAWLILCAAMVFAVRGERKRKTTL
jgi:hypothetical protein